MKQVLMHIEGLTIGHKDKTLYKDVCFDICKGDCILLCGANGSGKTTLLKILSENQGNGSAVMIPTRIPKVKGFTLREFIELSCRKQPQSRPDEALAALSLTDLADRDISTLSDGEFQKGTIAAAVARQADIILLDEPTAFLDAENKRMVLRTLRGICDKTSTAIIFSTHDLQESLPVCNKVLALSADGCFRYSASDLADAVSTIFTNI